MIDFTEVNVHAGLYLPNNKLLEHGRTATFEQSTCKHTIKIPKRNESDAYPTGASGPCSQFLVESELLICFCNFARMILVTLCSLLCMSFSMSGLFPRLHSFDYPIALVPLITLSEEVTFNACILSVRRYFQTLSKGISKIKISLLFQYLDHSM